MIGIVQKGENMKYITVSQLANKIGINKRTIQYYGSIGLFVADKVGENGYRYYNEERIFELELILALKEIGMKLEDIKGVLGCDVTKFNEILKTRLVDIDEKIKKLQDLKFIIQEKIYQTDVMGVEDCQVSVVEMLDEEFFVQEVYGKNDFEKFLNLMRIVKEESDFRVFNNKFGYLKDSKDIMEKNFEGYSMCYYQNSKEKACTKKILREGGKYLWVIVRGNYEKICHGYEQIYLYCKKNNLQISGYAFERGVYDTIMKNEEENVTEIFVKVKE